MANWYDNDFKHNKKNDKPDNNINLPNDFIVLNKHIDYTNINKQTTKICNQSHSSVKKELVDKYKRYIEYDECVLFTPSVYKDYLVNIDSIISTGMYDLSYDLSDIINDNNDVHNEDV
jgi:hypothetical protein